MTYPPEPSHDDCTANTRGEWQGLPTMAIWYPSMGGYVAHAVAVDTGEGDLDVYVWHDGEFPFSDASPVRLHHCSAADFTRFGREIDTWLSKDAAPPTKVPATYDDAIRARAARLEAAFSGAAANPAATGSTSAAPRSWSLPVIPDDVTRVRDRGGIVWHRAVQPLHWETYEGTPPLVDEIIAEAELWARGPLTEVTEEQP